MNRILDWLDEAAGGVIRLAYLTWGIVAVAAYFSDTGAVPHPVTLVLNAAAPWVLAGALETHTYLTARRVRSAWQEQISAALGSEAHTKASGALKVNLGILAGLLTFSVYNQLQYLAATWTPPASPLTPGGPWPYLIRALVTPSAFMAAAFLAPPPSGIVAQVEAEAHGFARFVFQIARRQWRDKLREMKRQRRDVTGLFVQLVEDPAARHFLETIHAGIYDGTPASPLALPSPTSAPETRIPAASDPAPLAPERDQDADQPKVPEPPARPPTGPGSPAAAPRRARKARTVAELRAIMTPRNERPSRAAASALRARREELIGDMLQADPGLSIRTIRDRLKRGGDTHISENTVNGILRVLREREAASVGAYAR